MKDHRQYRSFNFAGSFTTIMESEKMADEWRVSVLILISKNKGDIQHIIKASN